MTASSRRSVLFLAAVVAALGVAGLGSYLVVADGRTAKAPKQVAKSKGGGARAVLVSAIEVQPRTLEIYEDVVGSLENVMDPKIAAEVAGRVTQVLGFTGKKVKRGELLAAATTELDQTGWRLECTQHRATMPVQQCQFRAGDLIPRQQTDGFEELRPERVVEILGRNLLRRAPQRLPQVLGEDRPGRFGLLHPRRVKRHQSDLTVLNAA